MLLLGVAAYLFDLVAPITTEEYASIMLQQVLRHEPPSAETRAYYLVKGQVLACFLRPGMTDEEVRRVLGIRPNGWVREGERWTDTYSLLGLTVRYRVAEVARGSGLGIVVEEVEASPP